MPNIPAGTFASELPCTGDPASLARHRLLLATSPLFFGAACFTVLFPDTPDAGAGSFVSLHPPHNLAVRCRALWRYLGPKSTAGSLLSLSACGFTIEMIGVATGFPYGPFYYGDSLGPKVANLVPYLLPLPWVPLVLGAVSATAPEAKIDACRRVLWVFSAAVLLTLMDGVLDPGAISLGFWMWPEDGLYYGVPVGNYLGWLLSSALAAAILLAIGHQRWESVSPPPGLLDNALIAIAFWVGVALFSGLLFPALLGGTLFSYLLLRRTRLATRGG